MKPTELSLEREAKALRMARDLVRQNFKESTMPPKGYGQEWGDIQYIAYDPMAGVKEYTSQMQSIYDLPIPGLEKPQPVPVVEARIISNHRRFRDE